MEQPVATSRIKIPITNNSPLLKDLAGKSTENSFPGKF